MSNKYNNDLTNEDYDFIKKNYNNMSVIEIAKILSKAKSTIYKAIYKLNLEYDNRNGKPWTKEEIDFLKENFNKYTYAEIAKKLKRSEKAVQSRAHMLNIVKKETSKNWTKEEIEFLKENINKLNYKEISKHINRTIGAIYNKVYELQLINDDFKNSRVLKRDQVLFIIANYETMTDSQLATKFCCSIEAISAVRHKYNLKKESATVHGPTYIEEKIKKLLDKYNIGYYYNKQLGQYKPDFQIKNTKLIIEVQGDYFHCNPYLYKEGPEDEIQIKTIFKDYYKKCFYLSNGYTLIELWENDINNNYEVIEEKIKSIAAVYGQISQRP